jgi:hypothetical protein
LTKVLVDSELTPTVTTDVLLLRTSCDSSQEIVTKGPARVSFFMH